MLRYYPQNRYRNGKMKPPIYPRKKTGGELMNIYNVWKASNPHIEGFDKVEMSMYMEGRRDIEGIINYRLHGIYDKWITKNSRYKGFTEREFGQFLDEGKSIEEIINNRHPSELFVKEPSYGSVTRNKYKEIEYHIDSISSEESLEYSSTDEEMEYVEEEVYEDDE